MAAPARRRYGLVGAGARAEMFIRAIAVDHRDTAELVALADPNQARMDAHNRWLVSLGAGPVPAYPATAFTEMLDREAVDVALVTTVDRTHDEYVVAALEAGRDVVTEKPMTVDTTRCRRILDAVSRTGRRVTVAFNYRYNPVHERVRELLGSGEIGEIGSVHFEWLLDVRHGADYFRRWHRDKANSGGLLVHKSSHHFDLVNWWLGARPVDVHAYGRLFFYGEQGRRHGYARTYLRAHGSPEAEGDPFALRLTDHPRLRALYLDAEAEDGYLRDRNVFAPGVTIEDDLALLVRYDTGATMTYHLTAYAPWEGYRLMVNGSRGRLELEVVESDHVSPAEAGAVKGVALHGEGSGSHGEGSGSHGEGSGSHGEGSGSLSGVGRAERSPGGGAAAERGGVRLSVRPFWAPPRDIEVAGYTRAGHGGADARMAAVLIGGQTDPFARGATERDGALALLTGLAGNESMATGRPVHVADLLAVH